MGHKDEYILDLIRLLLIGEFKEARIGTEYNK